MVQTRSTPKPSKPQAIHPLTPAQTRETSSSASLPLPRRSRHLSPSPASAATPNPTGPHREGFLNLRSGKKVLKRTAMENDDNNDSADKSDDVAAVLHCDVVTPQSKAETSGVNVKLIAEDSDSGSGSDSDSDSTVRVSTGNRKRKSVATGSQREGFLNFRSRRRKRATLKDYEEERDDEAGDDDDVAVAVDEKDYEARDDEAGDDGERQEEENGDDVAMAVDENMNDLIAEDNDADANANANAPLRVGERGSGHRRNGYMERFHDIARENASRFAFFAPEEDNDGDRSSPVEDAVRDEIEDWPGPFSTAMKIIRDRGSKMQSAVASSQASLCDTIRWVPKAKEGNAVGVNVSVPSLQEICLKILVKNVDAIASLESVPDALRHRLSQLLCDSRRINGHFLELLVRGAPSEIRLRDCSWLSEEQFTECFRACDTENLVVLQLDQCGRCLPDYVIVATLAQSPRHLARLTTLSLSGDCRLSDGGLRALVSSASSLRSINLSQCSLLTSASIYILAESLKSLLKELYLDDCQGIDAALIVPALIELEHLEVLSVAGIQTVCDEFVENYVVARGQNMKELVLKDCINLTDASIKAIVQHCPGLCALDLMNLHKLTDLSIGHLTNGCHALHTLKLCRNPFSDEAISAFVETTGGSLKELSLNNIKKVGYHTTLSLANHAKNLHTLDLSWCRNLTDNALGLIVDSCLALRLLKLFGCSQVTDAFLNGHSNLQIQIIGVKMSPVLEHVKVPNPHQGALNYSSLSVN